jgi:hypothetical protein
MPGVPYKIERLARDELTSPAYRQLAAERFGAENWEAHVRYVRWLLDENPASRRDEPLPIFVCRDRERLIGQLTVIPVDLRFNGTPLRGGWCVDTFVLPAYQRQRIGEGLHTTAQRDVAALLTVGQTEAGYRLLRHLGFCVAGSLTHYRRLLRPVSGVAKKALEKAGLTDLARALFRRPTAREIPPVPILRVEPITSFAHIVDRHCDLRGPAGAPTRICRTAAFMQWRYCDHPFFHYAVRRLTIAGHGDAYAVWRLIDDGLWRRASLVDLVYPNGLPQSLIAHVTAVVTDCMRGDGAEIFDCQTSDAAVLAALGTRPLSRAEPGMRFLYWLGVEPTPSRATAEPWRLYAGDGDADTYMARAMRP